MLKLSSLNQRSRFLNTLRISHSVSRLSSSKNEYQKTLNLPNPGNFGLSMKNICKTESNIKKVANFDTLYQWQLENKKNSPKFILHDGPPYELKFLNCIFLL